MHRPIQLIVGLGNPGQSYEKTRHNVGQWFVHQVLKQHRGTPFKVNNRFHGSISVVSMGDHDVFLFLSNTYMNESGLAVRAIAQFYKIPPEAILIVHDELDLPVGVARLKSGGGSGGHNGLKSVTAHLGTEQFKRLRLGIAHPQSSHETIDYVLGRPSESERTKINSAIDDAIAVLPLVVEGDFDRAMNQLHTSAS